MNVVCDASVVIPWFHAEGESQVAESRAIAAARGSSVVIRGPDLLRWEVGNVLLRKMGVGADRAQAVLDRLHVITGPPVLLDAEVIGDAVRLAATHGLSLYDASYWALARATGSVLVTLDGELLAAGAGVTPAVLCERLGLG